VTIYVAPQFTSAPMVVAAVVITGTELIAEATVLTRF
jgi:hypothetical protein